MPQEQLLYFNNLYQTVRQNQQLFVDALCNSVTIINVGLTVCKVELIPLNPGTPGVNNGESVSFGGNRMEIFKGRIDINFPAGAGQVIVIQKIYLQSNNQL